MLVEFIITGENGKMLLHTEDVTKFAKLIIESKKIGKHIIKAVKQTYKNFVTFHIVVGEEAPLKREFSMWENERFLAIGFDSTGDMDKCANKIDKSNKMKLIKETHLGYLFENNGKYYLADWIYNSIYANEISENLYKAILNENKLENVSHLDERSMEIILEGNKYE